MKELRRLTDRAALVGAGILVVLIGISLFAYFFIWPQFGFKGSDEAPQLEPTAALIGTDLQHFQTNFGPWLTKSESEALRSSVGVRNLVLIKSTGDVSYSTKSTRFSPQDPWATILPPEITGVAVNGSVVDLRDQRGTRYTFNVTQPIVFEGDLRRVYVVDANRQIWSANTGDLEFVAAVDAVDPQIPANPSLSLSFGR